MADRIFVYGTLHPDQAPAEIADVMKAMKPLGEGSIRGTRYELGSYPGVKIQNKSNDRVRGDVFVLPNDPAALQKLDEYEEYVVSNPRRSLFRRRKATVTLGNGSRESCWVYVYNRVIPKSATQSAA